MNNNIGYNVLMSVYEAIGFQGFGSMLDLFSFNDALRFFEIFQTAQQKHQDDDESLANSREKCSILLREFNYNYNVDEYSEVLGYLSQIDFKSLGVNLASPDFVQNTRNTKYSIDDFPLFSDERLFDISCEAMDISAEMKQELISIKDELLKEGVTSRDLPNFFFNESGYNKLKIFLAYNVMAHIKKLGLDNNSEYSILPELRAIDTVISQTREVYEIIESCIDDVSQLVNFAYSCLFQAHIKNQDVLLFKAFYIRNCAYYYKTYSEYWKESLFDKALSKFLATPDSKIAFIKFLKGHRFADCFCNEYEQYIKEVKGKPLFNVSLVKTIFPDLVKDEDDNHSDWHKDIKLQKCDGGTSENMYLCLKNLCRHLKDTDCIDPNTPEDLFVYRFSGMLKPIPLDSKIKLSPNKQKGYIAYLLNRLYEGYGRKPYSKVSKFFDSELSNISALSDNVSNDIQKEISDILSKCGFKNCIEKKYGNR